MLHKILIAQIPHLLSRKDCLCEDEGGDEFVKAVLRQRFYSKARVILMASTTGNFWSQERDFRLIWMLEQQCCRRQGLGRNFLLDGWIFSRDFLMKRSSHSCIKLYFFFFTEYTHTYSLRTPSESIWGPYQWSLLFAITCTADIVNWSI